MNSRSVDALLASTSSNYRYLTGHRSRQFLIGTRPTVLVLPMNAPPVIMIHDSEVGDAAAQTWVDDVRGYSGREIDPAAIADMLRSLGLEQARIGCEVGPGHVLGIPQTLVADLQARLPKATLMTDSRLLEAVRSIKSAAEVVRIEDACRVAANAFSIIAERVRVGLTVAECELLCLQSMLEAGGDIDVSPIASFGTLPKSRVFVKGDMFQVDFTVARNGYRADLTRRAVFGRSNDDVRRDHHRIVALLASVMTALVSGTAASHVAQAFDEEAARFQLPNLAPHQWIGHGIGLDLLEVPALDANDPTPLRPGMVVTPEPWFLSSGRMVALEETVLITEGTCRILTQPSQHELLEIDH